MQDNETKAAPKRAAWNKGKLIGAKPPLRPKHVWSIRTKLQIADRKRDLAMFNLAIDSKLRGCDVVALKVEDIAPHGYAVERATVRQKKTGVPVRFEVTEQTRQAVDDYIRTADRKPGDFLFAAPRRPGRGLSTRQYARLVGDWIRGIGLDPCMFGTHSLRRTKATLIYRRTGNLRAVQLLLAIPRSKARCATSASRSTTLWRSPSKSTCDATGQNGAALPSRPRGTEDIGLRWRPRLRFSIRLAMDGDIFGHANRTSAGETSALRVLRSPDEACQNYPQAWRGLPELATFQCPNCDHDDRERRIGQGFQNPIF